MPKNISMPKNPHPKEQYLLKKNPMIKNKHMHKKLSPSQTKPMPFEQMKSPCKKMHKNNLWQKTHAKKATPMPQKQIQPQKNISMSKKTNAPLPKKYKGPPKKPKTKKNNHMIKRTTPS
jgi:hypothetical protein